MAWSALRYLSVGALGGLVCGCSAPAVPARPMQLTPTRTVVASDSGRVPTTPALAVAPGGLQAIAWQSTGSDGADSRLHVRVGDAEAVELSEPMGVLPVDPETPPKLQWGQAGRLHLLYAVSRDAAKPFREMQLRMRSSPDSGRTWTAPASVGDQQPWGGYMNDHALSVAPDGSVWVTWLGGRITDTTTARVARSLDHGMTWSASIMVDPAPTCECCRNGIAAVSSEEAVVAWRKQLPGGVRDIVVARTADGGATWSAPVRVHEDDWQIDACLDAGPTIAMQPNGAVHVAWWTGKPDGAGVKYARSLDGGRSFEAPIPLAIGVRSLPSHAQLTVTDDGAIAVVWEDATGAAPRLSLAVSHDAGASFDPLMRVTPDGDRPGYPVIGSAGNELVLLWRDRGASTALRLATAELGAVRN